jgi:hypothetical protein
MDELQQNKSVVNGMNNQNNTLCSQGINSNLHHHSYSQDYSTHHGSDRPLQVRDELQLDMSVDDDMSNQNNVLCSQWINSNPHRQSCRRLYLSHHCRNHCEPIQHYHSLKFRKRKKWSVTDKLATFSENEVTFN